MNLNQIINMIVRLLLRRAINTGINAGINAASNAASNAGKKRKSSQNDPRGQQQLGADRYGVPLHLDPEDEEEIAQQPQGQQRMTPEQRQRQREIRQARRAAKNNAR